MAACVSTHQIDQPFMHHNAAGAAPTIGGYFRAVQPGVSGWVVNQNISQRRLFRKAASTQSTTPAATDEQSFTTMRWDLASELLNAIAYDS